jgi:hypothetical protein
MNRHDLPHSDGMTSSSKRSLTSQLASYVKKTRQIVPRAPATSTSIPVLPLPVSTMMPSKKSIDLSIRRGQNGISQLDQHIDL